MDTIYSDNLMELGTSLATLAIKGTTSAINAKIKSIRDEKNTEKVRATYDGIINELILEREEAIQIAQVYKGELDRIIISDEDIQHLHNTVERILEIIKEMSPETSIESFEKFKALISIDALKTLQLLGFNYKSAIGEPLTQLCTNAISSIFPKTNENKNKLKK